MNLNIDTMTLDELRSIVKMLVREINDHSDRLEFLRDRISKLEIENESKKEAPK